MNPATATLATPDGLALFYRTWLPEGAPRALLVIVHGVMEHSGRHAEIATALCKAHLVVAALDLRGHGQSAGRRGHVNSWRDLVGDLDRFCDHLRERHAGLPLFLFGHSLGSLIALAYIMEEPAAARGLIISGTPMDPSGIARTHLVLIAGLFSRIWPTLTVRVRRAGQVVLSRDPEVDAGFKADPLVLNSLTARFGMESLAMIASLKQRAHLVSTPLLAIHGGADPLAGLAAAQGFFDQVSSRDKQMIVYPGSLHEVCHDRDQVAVFADVERWIERRI